MPWFWFDYPIIIIGKIFKLENRIYEEKVANFWCFLNMNHIWNMRKSYEKIFQLFLSLAVSFIMILPAIHAIFYKPSMKIFMISIINISLGFYLFGYNINAKTILIFIIPFCLIFFQYAHIFCNTILIAIFSCFYLMQENECEYAYFGCLALFGILGYTYENSYIIKYTEQKEFIRNSQNTNNILKIMSYSFVNFMRKHRKYLNKSIICFIAGFHLVENFLQNDDEYWKKLLIKTNFSVCFLWLLTVFIYSNSLLLISLGKKSNENTDDNLLVDDFNINSN